MKRFLMTIGLTCVLTASAIGGEIPSVPVAPPPPEDVTQTTTLSPGEISTSGLVEHLPDTSLNLLQMMLGLIV
ncbi:MAG: hypothetical protein AABN95_23915 [Acidobacteriota bacterium]